MPLAYLSLGSNLQPENNLRLGVRELGIRFRLLKVSSVFRNKAVGFEGDDFLNAVVCIETKLSPSDLCSELEEIHKLTGRRRGSDPYGPRTLDIDLLLYDSDVIESPLVPRPDVLKYSFVLKPLSEIAADFIHPQTGKTIAWHWSEFDAESHPLARDSLILSDGNHDDMKNRPAVTGMR